MLSSVGIEARVLSCQCDPKHGGAGAQVGTIMDEEQRVEGAATASEPGPSSRMESPPAYIVDEGEFFAQLKPTAYLTVLRNRRTRVLSSIGKERNGGG
jgi:hypothetical protein